MFILGHFLSWFMQDISQLHVVHWLNFQRDNNAMKIFVGGIANGTTEDDLRNYFSAYGTVNIVYMYIFAQMNLDFANL